MPSICESSVMPNSANAESISSAVNLSPIFVKMCLKSAAATRPSWSLSRTANALDTRRARGRRVDALCVCVCVKERKKERKKELKRKGKKERKQ